MYNQLWIPTTPGYQTTGNLREDLKMNADLNQPESKFLLSWEYEHIQITPGNSKAFQLTIVNQWTDEYYVEILVKGLPTQWVTVDKPVIHLGKKNVKLS
jgi:hypothetical protein